MSETINMEQAVLNNLRMLPDEKQQEVLDFIEFLVQKTEQRMQLLSDASSTTQQKKQLSLQEIARLPVKERHQVLAPFMAATADDFLNDPELTEFSVLDGEDWEKAAATNPVFAFLDDPEEDIYTLEDGKPLDEE